MENKKILITGLGGNVAQGIIRNIKNVFPNCEIICTDVASITAANYLSDVFYQVPYAADEKYISEIKKIIKIENVSLIIPTTDYESFFLSKNKKDLNCKVAISPFESVSEFIDKYKSYMFLKDSIVPFVETIEIENYNNNFNSFIAKPREGRGSRGILINPKTINRLSKDYVIQPYIEGAEFTTSFYVFNNKLHGFITLERELQNGATVICKENSKFNKKLLPIIEQLIKMTKLKGSVNLQFRVNNNKINIFEINCRISGTNSIRHNFGFQDVVYTIEEFLFEKNSLSIPKVLKNVYASRILLDVIYTDKIEDNKVNSKTKYKIY